VDVEDGHGVEGDETVTITLDAGAEYALGNAFQATVTIQDNDWETVLDNADPSGRGLRGNVATSTSTLALGRKLPA